MQLVCGYCGWTIDADGANPGDVLACPRCGQDVRVPCPEGGDDCEPAAVGFAEQAREAMKKAPTARVTCGGCGHQFTVGLRMCGRAVRCPSCRATVRIPYPDRPDEAHRLPSEQADDDNPAQESAEDANESAPRVSDYPDRIDGRRFKRGLIRVLLAAAVLAVAVLVAVIIIR